MVINAAAAVVQTTTGGSISAGVWTGVVLAALSLLTVIVKQWGPWKIIARDGRKSDLDLMTARINKLENLLEQKDAHHDAEVAVMRHRMNNLDQCLNMLLMLIEQDPDKAREAAARVRVMRERQEAAEASEKATIRAATITAAAVKGEAE